MRLTPNLFLATTLVPGLAWMTTVVGNKPGAGAWQDDGAGRLELLAFAGQETGWLNEAQIGGGPGRGPWQVGETTCADVLYNPASEQILLKLCTAANVLPTPPTIYDALMTQPTTFGVVVPRLILWCDDAPLAAYGDEAAALAAYIRVWRPGAILNGGTLAGEERTRFVVNYAAALAADQAWAKQQGTK